jgi:regulatory protein
MARRRGARAGRGWDAIPPRPAADDPQGDGLRRAGRGRGNAPNRRRGWPSDAAARRGDAGSGGADGGEADGSETIRNSDAALPGGDRSDAEVAREICLRQLAVRPRTRAELAQALTRRRIDDEVITEVLDRYDEVGMIDDAAFARAWVSSRHAGRGLARRALAGELRQRGVAGDVVGEALETLDDEQETATARALVDRKLRTSTGAPEAVFRRLVGMLARKGYPAGLAITTVKDALAARDAEAAEFAEQIDPDALAAEQIDPDAVAADNESRETGADNESGEIG